MRIRLVWEEWQFTGKTREMQKDPGGNFVSAKVKGYFVPSNRDLYL
jgi:hypothetical protein